MSLLPNNKEKERGQNEKQVYRGSLAGQGYTSHVQLRTILRKQIEILSEKTKYLILKYFVATLPCPALVLVLS